MRIPFDLPEHLFLRLKARAALEGRTLHDLVIDLVERGLMAAPRQRDGAKDDLPSISLGAPMALSARELSNATLAERLGG